MRTQQNRTLFTLFTLALMLVGGMLASRLMGVVGHAQTANEVCYSIYNNQGWTLGLPSSGLPASLASGTGSTFSRWRFDVVCNRADGSCRPLFLRACLEIRRNPTTGRWWIVKVLPNRKQFIFESHHRQVVDR